MITAAELQELVSCKLPAATLREKLAVGLQQETEEERKSIRCELLIAMSRGTDVFQVLLDATCNEVIVPADPDRYSLLWFALARKDGEAAMAVVERMRRDGLRVTRGAPFQAMFGSQQVKAEVMDAVVSVMDSSAFGYGTGREDALRFAIRLSGQKGAHALELVLQYGPTMQERLEAGMERFRYVHVASETGDLETVQQMHDLLPLLPDGSGRRGELEDYARAIDLAAAHKSGRGVDMRRLLEYLVEQAGDEEVLNLCHPTIIFHCRIRPAVEWLVQRAPQLLEAACRDPNCLSLLIGTSEMVEFLVTQMVKLVDREVLCGIMGQAAPHTALATVKYGSRGWRWMLQPIHQAVPESMDGLRWKWLMEAIEHKAYRDVEYMLGMCTREHLIMRNEMGP